MTDDLMTDDRDPLLMRLFSVQIDPAHGTDFEARFIERLERAGRRQRAYRIGMTLGGVIAAALLAPWIARGVAMAIASIAAGIAATHPLQSPPLAWLIVSSVVVSFLPVIYLGITRRW